MPGALQPNSQVPDNGLSAAMRIKIKVRDENFQEFPR
jgi:hypothetical protein